MLLEMLQSQAGPRVDRLLGKRYEIDETEAKRMIKAGIARPVKSTKVEKAVKS